MGYDYYFINETKKQVVGPCKKLYLDFEDGSTLLAYLSLCKHDTIRIVGEEDSLVESVVNHYDIANRNYDYKYIELFSYKIGAEKANEAEIDRFHNDVYDKEDTE